MVDRYRLTSALAALLLAACSGADETTRDDGNADPTNLISYTVAASQTRSTVIRGTEFPVEESFRVWAYEEEGDAPLIDGGIVSCTNGSVWSTQEKYYWPDGGGKVSFYALYPTTLDMDGDTKSFDYLVRGPVDMQEDILYDVVTAGKTDDDVSHNPIKRYAVPLTFHHALSQIAFRGRVNSDNKDWTVSVSNIKVCNVAGWGKFDLTTRKWSDLSGVTDYSVGLSEEAASFSYDDSYKAIDLTAPDGVLLMIPQALQAWDRKENALKSADSYLAIDCHICQGATDVIGSFDQPETVYVPFDSGSSSWQQGYRYTYTLEFGTGYTEDGQPHLRVLIISSEITDWAEGDGDDLGAKMTNE